MKLALIDIDGVISNSDARFSKASQAKTTLFQQSIAESDPERVKELVKQADNAYWRTAFTPELVALDTLIDGVPEAVKQIEQAGYVLYFLTSRPESMREATGKWLVEHKAISFWYDKLIMKPSSQQFVKTVTWKAGVVELLVRLFGVDDLMVIDDEVAIQEAIAALDLSCDRKIGGSLVEALAMLEVK